METIFPLFATITANYTQATKVCRYNWLGWPFSMLKYKYIFQIKYIEKQFYQTALGNCYGLKLPKY